MAEYCIVGAGPAGLAAARAFTREELDFDAYERLAGVGGIWDFSNVDSPVYANTHFISSAKLSGFEDFPMPAHFPDYPRHDQVLDYLHAFAREYDLLGRIRLSTRVRTIQPQIDGIDVVLDDFSRRRYRGVVVATGHNWSPLMPSYPGELVGEQLHSLRYRTPAPFTGCRVLVVGGGNSACDIACDLTAAAERVMLSLRRGYHFLPKHILGVPTDEFAQSRGASGAAFTMMLKMMSAKLARHGVPLPTHGLFEANPVVNTNIIQNVLNGAVTVKPDIERLDGADVRFNDGSSERVDAIVYATGYRLTTPVGADPMTEAQTPVDSRDMFLNMFHPGRSDLAVMGMFETDGGAFPIFSRQADLVARVMAAGERSPVRAERFEDLRRGPLPDLRGGRSYLHSERHSISVDRRVYMERLHATLGSLS